MLRIVHPRPSGQATDPPKRRGYSPPMTLTPDEVRHVRAALHNLRRAFGGWSCLSAATDIPVGTLVGAATKRAYRASGTLAIRVAKAAGTSVEAVLTGALNAAGRCPTCGHRPGAGRLTAGGAS